MKLFLPFYFVFLINGAHISAQTKCDTKGITFIRQSQLDSFDIWFPGCTHATDIDVYGTDIVSLRPLRNIKKANSVAVRRTNVVSLEGLDSLISAKACVVSLNNKLRSINVLQNLKYSEQVAINNNDQLENYHGLVGDSLYGITLSGNIKTNSLLGLKSKYCKSFSIYDAELSSLGSTHLPNVESMLLSNVNTIDSLSNYSKLINLIIELTPISNLVELSSLTNLNTVEFILNSNLSECAIDIICKNLDNPLFNLYLSLNAPGCNSKEEIRPFCMSSTDGTNVIDDILIYPNPVSDVLSYKPIDHSHHVMLEIYDTYGKLVSQKSISPQDTKSIILHTLPSGMYMARWIIDNRKVVSKKFVKL